MGILSFLFPTEEDRLRRVRELMAKGRHADARSAVMKCRSPEADALYDACSAAIDAADRSTTKKALAKRGFHGWKIEVSARSARRRTELEALVAEELAAAGIDLDLPELDQKVAKAAIARAERRTRKGGTGQASVRLVPLVDRADG